MKGKTDRDHIKNAGIPTGVLKGAVKNLLFYSPLNYSEMFSYTEAFTFFRCTKRGSPSSLGSWVSP